MQKLYADDAPSDILNEGVSPEEVGLKWVELKEIEDELVRIHKRMRCVSIDQVRRVLTLSGESLFEDVTDAGVKASADAVGLGENEPGPIPGNMVRQIDASKLLTYINKQAGKANAIRGIVFNDIVKKGYPYKRPQKIARGSTKGPEMRSKDKIWKPRLFYTRKMEIEKEGITTNQSIK